MQVGKSIATTVGLRALDCVGDGQCVKWRCDGSVWCISSTHPRSREGRKRRMLPSSFKS